MHIRQRQRRRRLFCYASLLVLTAVAIAVLPEKASGQIEAQRRELLELSGHVESVRSTELKATLDSVPMVVQLNIGGDQVTTSVLVSGIDRVDILERGLHVRFVAQLDASGDVVRPVTKIEARDQPIGNHGRRVLATANQPALQPDFSDENAAGTQQVEFCGLLARMSKDKTSIDVNIPAQGNRPERMSFPVDPETTQVEFAMIDVTKAKKGDLILVRGVALPQDVVSAAEVRISRLDVFPEAQFADASLNPWSRPAADPDLANEPDPQVPSDDATEPEGHTDGQSADAEVAMEEPGALPQGTFPAQPENVEEFDFPKNAPEKTAEEKARRHYKIN